MIAFGVTELAMVRGNSPAVVCISCLESDDFDHPAATSLIQAELP